MGLNGHVYIVDTYNHRIKKIENGVPVPALNGSAKGGLRFPSDVAFAENGDSFVADSDHNQIVHKISKSGLLRDIKDFKTASGVKSFSSPSQIGIFAGKLYISDTFRDQVVILDLETNKADVVPVRRPYGMAIRSTGELIITQRGCNYLSVLRGGVFHKLAGSTIFGFIDGFETATFYEPAGLAATLNGAIIIADAGNHAIRQLDLDGRVTTLAGTRIKGQQDGADATFNYPMGVCAAPDGSIFVADTYNHSIRKIFPNLETETVI
jgi:DNA-binding beta-propeller fold protein YncE